MSLNKKTVSPQRLRKRTEIKKKDVEFFESDLAWRTAKILAKRLESQGAKVMISRKKGKSVLF